MIIMCIIGGYFATIYTLNLYDQSIIEEGIKQVGSKEVLIAISVVQVSIYAVIFSALGIILSNKIGLWKKFEKNKVAIIGTIIISVLGGLTISVFDKYVFGHFIDSVLHSYDSKPSIEYIITAFTYGGVFEEILLRLFFMSLIAWIIAKIFFKKEQSIPIKVFVIANIISALLFAAGHIPSTIQSFGYIDGLILFRCFLLNGGFGLAFGWLYRKYGIGYLDIFGNGFYAPLVDLDFKFKKPLIYGKKAIVKTRYINSDAAKLIFEYEIVSAEDGSIIATGSSTQVFLNKSYELILSCPDFYLKWKKDNGLILE